VLTLYRRHLRGCPHAQERFYKRCKACPVWVQGVLMGRKIRHSMRTASWERAEVEIKAMDTPEPTAATSPVATDRGLLEAYEAFYKECERRQAPATLRKYRYLQDQLEDFCRRARIETLKQFTVQHVRDFRNTWTESARSANKKLERLRAFFNFCVENEWAHRNPAKLVKLDKVRDNPTLPFTDEEMERILANAGECYAFILTLRYTGMRISDVALLRKDSIRGERIHLYTAKTGTPVYIPIPEFLARELAARPVHGGYLFLRGESTRLDTATDMWRRQLAKVFTRAGIAGAHPHRFRDTFAVSLLERGVPLEVVSKLLGHASIRVTERHYAPWVKSLQDRLEAEVKKAWDSKPQLVRMK
jgi:integrase/recombinase XerD